MDALKGIAAASILLAPAPAGADPLPAWRPFVTEAARRFAMPEAWILRVISAESAGMTHMNGAPIRSRVGAMGLMQLMPATWATMRTAHGLGADPDDPRANILAGTAYLRMMYDRFGYPGLFGAYNAGPGRYAAHRSRGAGLPLETRDYMAKIAGMAQQAAPAIAAAPLPDGVVQAIYEPAPPTVFAVRGDDRDGAAEPSAEPGEMALIFAIRKVGR